MANKVTCLIEFPLGRGAVRLINQSEDLRAYEHGTAPPEWWMEYVQGSQVHTWRTLQSAADFLRAHDCDLEELLQRCPERIPAVAEVVSRVANLGRVVAASPIYDFVEEAFTVKLADFLPVVSGGVLRFAVIGVEEDSSLSMTQFIMGLRSLELSEVERRQMRDGSQ